MCLANGVVQFLAGLVQHVVEVGNIVVHLWVRGHVYWSSHGVMSWVVNEASDSGSRAFRGEDSLRHQAQVVNLLLSATVSRFVPLLAHSHVQASQPARRWTEASECAALLQTRSCHHRLRRAWKTAIHRFADPPRIWSPWRSGYVV